MKLDRNIVQMMNGLRAVSHGHYREMCSLAALGQLGGPQMSELNEHVTTCDSCRIFLESVAQASLEVMPALAESRIGNSDVAPPEGMRTRFLARLAKETAAGRDTKSMASFAIPRGESRAEAPIHRASVIERPVRRVSAWYPAAARAGAVLATCAVIASGAFYLGERRISGLAPQPTAAELTKPASTTEDAALGQEERVRRLEAQKQDLESQLVEMKAKLSRSTAEQTALENELEDARKQLEAVKAAEQTLVQDTSKEKPVPETRAANLENDLDRLNLRLADSEMRFAAEKQTVEDLRGKLELTEANLQQELNRKDSAGEIGALVAARNLHIVDVYDADPSGKQQRSFGRVLYVEGKSLVFYAYDLDDRKQFKTNVVFYVWGGKAGVKEVTHNLGILHKDDDGQGRWAMTFDDPKVLSEINSVFVTAEAPNKHYDQPRGRKVLYAYFGGQPNHP